MAMRSGAAFFSDAARHANARSSAAQEKNKGPRYSATL